MSDETFTIVHRNGQWFFNADGEDVGPFDSQEAAREAATHDATIDRLDEGLEDTFPASDPVSATIP